VIEVLIGEVKATFDETHGWTCDDSNVERTLKFSFEEEDVSPEMTYWVSRVDERVRGLDAYALDEAAEFYDIKVTKSEPLDVPEEKEGVFV